MINIPFNSKETYLAYRSAWKAEYKNLSAEIRTLRLADRAYQRRQFGHQTLTAAEEASLAAADRITGDGSYGYKRQLRRVRATAMLAELKEAKQEAQRQYLARKAAATAVPPTVASA